MQPLRVDIDQIVRDPDAFLTRIRRILAGHVPRRQPAGTGTRRAAVLMPLVTSAEGAAVILTKRTDVLEHHRGQISFPGGRIEPGESPLDAALRETFEEIGVPPGDVEVLGHLDEEVVTVSGFTITPFVGTVASADRLRLNAREVRASLEVPLTAFLDPRNVRTEVWERDGRSRVVHFYAVGSEVVWGATARIIAGFLHTVLGAPSSPAGQVT